MSTGVQQPSVRFCSSQLDCYTSKVTAVVSVTLTAADIQGADLHERAFGFLLASPSGRCPKQTRDRDSQLALIHLRHTKPSRFLVSIAWKSVEGGAKILDRVVVTTRYVCPGIPRRSRSYLNRFSLFAYRR